MATDVLMPQMGESIAEGTITRWLVAVGETVERDQPLLEISTDKVDAEVPSPAGGVFLAMHYGEGATVGVNEVIGRIGEAGESVADAEPVSALAVAQSEPPANEATSDTVSPDANDAPLSLEARLKRYSSPVVRKIAAEHGIELAAVSGTGIHGRVTKKDVLGFIESGGADAAAPADVPAAMAGGAAPSGVGTPQLATPRPAGDFFVPAYRQGERVEIEAMSRIRALTAAHMTYSKATSAHVSSVFEIDMSRVDQLRRRAKDRFLRDNNTKLTYMPFIFKAVASALKRYPTLNAAIDGRNIVYKKDINLGIAVAMDHGLIVPVVKNADTLSLVGLAKTANDLADRARTKRLKPEEVQGGTFTITNPGVFGSLFGTPIINQPQVAILGIGAIEKRPVVVTDDTGNDALAIRTMCCFAITFDHRLVDGADADRFMAEIKASLATDDWKDLDGYR